MRFHPVDFLRATLHESLADGLGCVGFDLAQRTFFTWLGVVPYLTPEAVYSMLGFIARLPAGAHVVFDYSNPPDLTANGVEATAARQSLATRVASVGEPFSVFLRDRRPAHQAQGLGLLQN